MWDYEGMKEAGLNTWTIRECAVQHEMSVTKDLERLLDDILEGKYCRNDFLKDSTKSIAMRMVKEIWESGVELGFTYSVPEFKAYLEFRDDELL